MRFVPLLLVVACATGVDDAAEDDASSADGGGGAVASGGSGGTAGSMGTGGLCDVSAPFGEPLPVSGVNSDAEEFGARLTADELTMYIASNRPAGTTDIDIYIASRASTDDAFGTPVRLDSVSSTDRDINPSITADGLSFYLQSTRAGGPGSGDIFVSTRSTLVADFGAPEVVAAVNDANDDGDPYILPSGDALYFASNRAGTYDIFRAARQPSGTFDAPVALDAINDTADDVLPVVSADELTIYFASESATSTA